MELDDYMWKHKVSAPAIAKLVDSSPQIIRLVRKKKNTPGLALALKISQVTNGEVSLKDLLRDKDFVEYSNWESKISA